jgi:hypothetical protein
VNYGEEETHAEKNAVEGYGEIVVEVHSHGAVETVRCDDSFQKECHLPSQDLLV